jgi:hypothetical protein
MISSDAGLQRGVLPIPDRQPVGVTCSYEQCLPLR